MKPITWNELADLYDAAHNGRRARTLPMDSVFGWAEKQIGRFHVSEDGALFHVKKEERSNNALS